MDRLLTILGIEHLRYQLIHARILINRKEYETWLCASENFKRQGESKVALDAYYQAECLPEESPLDFCIRMGWEETIYQMLSVDYLILNRDRHGANMEVLRNPRQKTVRLAPCLIMAFPCSAAADRMTATWKKSARPASRRS